jgi:hypothetical protein
MATTPTSSGAPRLQMSIVTLTAMQTDTGWRSMTVGSNLHSRMARSHAPAIVFEGPSERPRVTWCTSVTSPDGPIVIS